jgi:hypothetical protein
MSVNSRVSGFMIGQMSGLDLVYARLQILIDNVVAPSVAYLRMHTTVQSSEEIIASGLILLTYTSTSLLYYIHE